MYAAAHARLHPDQPMVIMEPSGEVITFSEHEARANRLAHLFRDRGLVRGDHVAFLVENNARYFELIAAAERSGLYFTCINSHLTADEVAYIVDDCDAKVLIASAATRDAALGAARVAPKVETFLMIDAEGDDGPFVPYARAVAELPSGPIADESLGVAMLYSSGTTGKPKGIWRELPDNKPSDPMAVIEFVKFLLGLHPGARYLSPAPMYHSAPLAALMSSIRLGATAVVMERFDPELFLASIERHEVTHTQVVPTMFSRLLKLPEEIRTRYDLSSLERCVHAAAPCPIPVKEQMIEWWGPIITEYYGATEGNGFTLCTSEEWLAHKGTVGKAVLGTPHIFDEDGKECPAGEVGTIYFEGATEFHYYGDEAKTAESRDPSGAMSTLGDMGYLDEEGFLYLTDRASYMIISGGVNIYPQECENLLITHPKVADAAVFGVPNADLGEEVRAVVQPAAGVSAGDALGAELIAFCREHLATYKCPRQVDFEAELPRSPAGKLYKRRLRDRYWADHTTRIV